MVGGGRGRSSDVTDCISGGIAPRKPRADAITGAMLFHDEEIDNAATHFWPFNKKKRKVAAEPISLIRRQRTKRAGWKKQKPKKKKAS